MTVMSHGVLPGSFRGSGVVAKSRLRAYPPCFPTSPNSADATIQAASSLKIKGLSMKVVAGKEQGTGISWRLLWIYVQSPPSARYRVGSRCRSMLGPQSRCVIMDLAKHLGMGVREASYLR